MEEKGVLSASFALLYNNCSRNFLSILEIGGNRPSFLWWYILDMSLNRGML